MNHWIQDHILLELTRHASRRYSQLRPTDVEGNLFMYHLRSLLAGGMVQKQDGQYQLTAKGLQHVGLVSLKTGKLRQQPKILTTVICKNANDEYLFVRWHRQPNAGLISFPHGMVHFGEAIADMAALELSEKAGLQAKLQYKGDIYVRGVRDDVIDRHMLVHIFKATQHRAHTTAKLRPDVSESFWAPLQAISENQYVPGFYQIAQLAANLPQPPFLVDVVVPVQ